MRDDDGVFVGAHLCSHWLGVESYREEECCGGRTLKAAWVRCELHGTVRAESRCCAACGDRQEAVPAGV
jgi:hypothetical protein